MLHKLGIFFIVMGIIKLGIYHVKKVREDKCQ